MENIRAFSIKNNGKARVTQCGNLRSSNKNIFELFHKTKHVLFVLFSIDF